MRCDGKWGKRGEGLSVEEEIGRVRRLGGGG